METNGRQEENAMKKYFSILAAALALCLSIAFVPAASTTSERPESLPTGQTPVVRQISVSRKTEEMVWVPTHGGKKYHKKSTCSGMKDPEKVPLSEAKEEGFTACKRCYR